MKMFKEKTWQSIGTFTESNAEVFGQKVFPFHFKSTGKTVEHKGKVYYIYEIAVNGILEEFAMVEVSNGVYDFLIFKY